ncbi:MAG: ABC transporter ATP-binding protein [Candidatus Nomurabacteria bacterium]|jgi:putative ABC transport system ATP-binding protein|nr:ABC transporter ATP-binding protein [Candidatus Nomurabacteria bacterium]
MIEVKHVTKTYGDKQNPFTALHDVNFSIPDGATVAIVGKSGSGKSTLMHAMSGLDRPEKGQVIIDGRDILQLSQNKVDSFRAREMAFIFQSFFVEGNDTCAANVGLPLEINDFRRSVRDLKVTKALHAVGLSEKKHSLAKNLSGGQKQRLAIARAIVNEPKILFADEPTGNLDSVTGATVEKLLFSYNKKFGTTLIIVTHDHDLAAKCEMQIHTIDGRVDKITHKGVKNA